MRSVSVSGCRGNRYRGIRFSDRDGLALGDVIVTIQPMLALDMLDR